MYNWKLPKFNSSLNGCKILTENLTCCVFLKWKNDAFNTTSKKYFFSIPNLTRCKTFKSKNDAYWIFKFKIMLFKKAPKMQNKSFLRSKTNQNVIFWMQTYFQNLTCPKFFYSKSNALYFFQSKIWRVVNLLNRNLTSFEFLFQNLTR